MDVKRKKKVLNVLNSYSPIKGNIGPFGENSNKAKALVKLRKSPAAAERFLDDPEFFFKKEKLVFKGLDEKEAFISLVSIIEDMQARKKKGGKKKKDIASKKKTKTMMKRNFDNNRGRFSSTASKREAAFEVNFGVDNDILKIGDEGPIDLSAAIMKGPLGSLFYPDQPLVTPELINKIKKILK